MFSFNRSLLDSQSHHDGLKDRLINKMSWIQSYALSSKLVNEYIGTLRTF